ncbi:hypothetical protein ALC62_05555, partial [Cyphomyrmex costatus]
SFAMTITTFVDLQGFIVGKKFIAKEVAVLREGTILSHYIFTCPIPWNYLTKSEKYCASWLGAYHHGLQWEDGMIPYSMTKRLITMAVIDAEWNGDNKAIVYVKGREKRQWLADILDSENICAICDATVDRDIIMDHSCYDGYNSIHVDDAGYVYPKLGRSTESSDEMLTKLTNVLLNTPAPTVPELVLPPLPQVAQNDEVENVIGLIRISLNTIPNARRHEFIIKLLTFIYANENTYKQST